MKYCTGCGAKLKANTKFCSKCGAPTELYLEEQRKLKKEKSESNKEKLLLIIGTALIIIASAIFAFANWNEMTGIFKVLFLLIESFLFLSISLFSKKVNEKLPYKFLWFVGISFIPIIFHLVAYDKLLGEYLSYSGAGIYVYLAICAFVCIFLYFASDKLFKSNLYVYFSYIFINLTIIFTLYAFKLDNIFNYNLVFPILSLIYLIVSIFYDRLKNDNAKKTINVFASVVLVLFSIFTSFYMEHYRFEYILISVTFIINMASLFIILFKSNKNGLIYIYPVILYALMNIGIYEIFYNYANIITLIIILGSLLINFISNIKENEIISLMSFILMLINIIFMLLFSVFNNLTLLIISILLLVSFIFMIKIYNNKIQSNVLKISLPVVLLLFIYSLSNEFITLNLEVIYLIVSVICFTISVMFYQKKKDIFLKNTFEISSYVLILFSTFIILFTGAKEISFILNEMVWLYYFIFNSITKKNKVINSVLLSLLISNFVICSYKFSISIYYSLMFVATITSVLDFINRKFNKGSYYIYISLACVALATIIFDLANVNLIGLSLIVLNYAFTYYLLVNKHNLNFVFKYIFTLIGFALINVIFNYFISTYVLACLFTLVTYVILLICMFLLRVDEDRKIFSYYIVVGLGAFALIDSALLEYKFDISLNLIVVISIILVYFERVFKLREIDKITVEIVLISLAHFYTLFDVVIVNIVFAAFYIFYGFYKKRNSFSILGTSLLIATLIINLFKIAENMTVTYVLLVIGLVMLGYVFYIEARKNNK